MAEFSQFKFNPKKIPETFNALEVKSFKVKDLNKFNYLTKVNQDERGHFIIPLQKILLMFTD